MSARPLLKFSAVSADGTDLPVRYGNVWTRHAETNRLMIGPDSDPLGLLLDLSASWKGPFKVLYVLLLALEGREPGRYESAWLSRDDAESLLSRYGRFLSGDGRHHVWLASPVEKKQVVWDRHELLYAYGPPEPYEAILRARGFREGTPQVPCPHAHHYHPEFHADALAFLEEHAWIRWRLASDDED